MRKVKWYLPGAAVLLLVAVVLARPRTPYLILQSESCGRQLVRLTDREFAVRFVHTIQKTEVIERFIVEPSGELQLFETEYSSLGVGLPDDAGLGFALENGRFKLKLDRRVPELRWWVTPVARQMLLWGEQKRGFTRFARPGELLTIRGRWSRRVGISTTECAYRDGGN